MAATIRSHNNGATSSSSTPSFTVPATVEANDLICFAFIIPNNQTITGANGYTVHSSLLNTGRGKIALVYKTAAGTEDGTSVQPVTFDASQVAKYVGFVLTAGTYNTSSPFQASPTTLQEDSVSTTTGIAITTPKDDMLYLYLLGVFNNGRTHDSATSPLTKLNSNGEGNNPSFSLWTGTQTTAGSTGNKSITLSGLGDIAAIMLYVDNATVAHSAAASVSGDASIAAPGALVHAGSASPSGQSSVSPAGVIIAAGVSSLSGAGALAAVGALVQVGISALSGNGSVIAPGVKVWTSDGLLQGSGDVLANAVASYVSGADLGGNAIVGANGGMLFSGSIEIIGIASLSADHIWYRAREDEAPEGRYTFGMGSRRRATYTFQESTPPAKVTFKVER